MRAACGRRQWLVPVLRRLPSGWAAIRAALMAPDSETSPKWTLCRGMATPDNDESNAAAAARASSSAWARSTTGTTTTTLECLTAATCPGTDTECQVRTCVGGSCGVAVTAAAVGTWQSKHGVPATKKLMARLGIKISDFDLIELNEAFASQGIACLRQLGVKDDADFVNPHGGAIALGHPLGMSGARLAMTAVHGMEKRGGKLALATMCVGVGQGVAVAIEKIN